MNAEPAIIVTGGAGFIGSNFIHTWLEAGAGLVVNLDKLTYAGNLENLEPLAKNPNHIFVKGDIGDRQLVAGLLDQYRPNAIVNFAAESHVDRSISAPDEFIQTNLVGTFNLLEKVRDHWQGLGPDDQSAFRFLHVSTDEVYGSLEKDDPAFSETTPYSPNSPYSASKAGSRPSGQGLSSHLWPADADHQLLQQLRALPVSGKTHSAGHSPCVERPEDSGLRGWCQHPRLAVRQGPLPGDNGGTGKGRAGEVYNIGGNSEKTNLDVVHTICTILDEVTTDQNRRTPWSPSSRTGRATIGDMPLTLQK